MNLKVAIVGLPNAGKSTLFNALLKKQVADAANYPFTTIEPNVGVVPVPDSRLEALANIYNSPIVPAVVEFVDIAGLVKGAAQGEGLGNKFLSHIRETHLIVNVLRFFEDPSVVHVAGDVDPDRDRDIIETELVLADLQTVEKQEDSSLKTKLMTILDSGKPSRDMDYDLEETKRIRELNLLTMKPILYVANVSEDQIEAPGSHLGDSLSISAKVEAELAGLPEIEQKEYLKSLGLESSGLDRLIAKAYEMLGLISFLTCGVIEARAWTIEKGTKAPQAAGVIHTDFEKKFIKADVVDFNNFINPGGLASPKPSEGGWVKVREAGKVRSEGKEYLIQDGDVIEFKIGV